MLHTVHYPVLSARLVSLTLGSGTVLDRLLEVLSTARYGLSEATGGKVQTRAQYCKYRYAQYVT